MTSLKRSNPQPSTPPSNSTNTAVRCVSELPSRQSYAEDLAGRLQLSLIVSETDSPPGINSTGNPTHPEWLLVVFDNRLELLCANQPRSGGLSVNLLSGRLAYRLRTLNHQKNPIARAMGWRLDHPPSIVDATAGLIQDTMIFAGLGCQVTAVERSPILAELIRDGLHQALKHGSPQWVECAQRVTLIESDARMWLASQRGSGRFDRPDVVFLDPMYPDRPGAALVKKEMRICRKLVGEDPDANELLDVALQTVRQRVVVKRAKGVAPLSLSTDSEIPTTSVRHFEIVASRVRYDVYQRITG